MTKKTGLEAGSAPGRDAIDAALAEAYRDAEPIRYSPAVPAAEGGPDPLDGIAVHAPDEPAPHWHFVTFGLSDLRQKSGGDPGTSGFGFELTFRVVRREEEEPPAWALNFLQNLARYVFQTGNSFAVGHYMDAHGPLAVDTDSALRAVVFGRDPQLDRIDTPNGSVEFLQVVGITLDEVFAIKCWNAEGFLELMEESIPLLLTDLSRRSILEGEAVLATVRTRAGEEGSATGGIFAAKLDWELVPGRDGASGATVTIGAYSVGEIAAILPLRVGHGRQLLIVSAERKLLFDPGDRCAVSSLDEMLALTLTGEGALEIATLLRPVEGSYRCPSLPGVTFEVRKSHIEDRAGNVVEVIG